MPAEKKGNYFKDKQEAVEFYKNSEENLKDKPEWMIECMIDFACQYPNYKEYLEVEGKVKNGEELTAKQKKKYGHMKWESEWTQYEDGQVIEDAFDVKLKGDYEDLTDPEQREKLNKYNLEFGESLKPDDHVTLRMKTEDGKEMEGKALIADLNEHGNDPEHWTFKEVPQELEE